jgi:hypothetical protein
MLRFAGIAVGALVFGLVGLIVIQQHILRWRAERLLVDVRQLQSRQSAWDDAMKFKERWSFGVSDGGPCSREQCSFWVEVEEPLVAWLDRRRDQNRIMRWIDDAYSRADWRYARANAYVVVRNSTIEKSSFDLFIEVPKGNATDFEEAHGLVGIAQQTSYGFPPYDFMPQRLDHPEFWVGVSGGCEGCVKLQVFYTPLVDNAKLLELTNFNFDCLTRWSPCVRESDLMPMTARQYEVEHGRSEARMQAFSQCKVPLDFLGQESRQVSVVDVISRVEQPIAGNAASAVRIRIDRSLKGAAIWPLGQVDEVAVYDPDGGVRGWSSADLAAGRQYIVLGSFSDEKSKGKVIAVDDCGVIPYTEESLVAIQKGVDASAARDVRLRNR